MADKPDRTDAEPEDLDEKEKAEKGIKQEEPPDPFARLMKKDFGQPSEPKPGEDGKEKKKPDDKKDSKPDEEYDEIDYNKEKVKIPATERKTYLQKGYNYDKVKARADASETALKRAAELAGHASVETFLADLERQASEKLKAKFAENWDDPDKIDELVMQHPKVKRVLEEGRRSDYEKGKEELRKELFFKELEPELDAMAAQNPSLSTNVMYSYLLGENMRKGKLDELLKAERETTEKRVIADVHDKERRISAPSGAGGKEEEANLSPMGSKLANIFGVNPVNVAKRAKALSKAKK